MASRSKNKSPAPILVLFRNDLRLHDNPSLHAAAETGFPVIPVAVIPKTLKSSRTVETKWQASSLASLNRRLRRIRSRLILREGKLIPCLKKLLKETNPRAVYWNQAVEPNDRKDSDALSRHLATRKIQYAIFRPNYLYDFDALRTQSGKVFRVFTPFWRSALSSPPPPRPMPSPRRLRPPKHWPRGLRLREKEDLFVSGGRKMQSWRAGESPAVKTLDMFQRHFLIRYGTTRDRPDLDETSRLSPHLHFGEISIRLIWDQLTRRPSGRPTDAVSRKAFLRQLIWREFAAYLLHHFPLLETRPLREDFRNFSWRSDPRALEAWKSGATGFPMIDAGMRELRKTGWIHNRVRLLVASFLVKNLMIDWRHGAQWFMDRLVDADSANNTFGWQWVAGCGADAAPYFRIFNPVRQGIKFDPKGAYVKTWVPELASLPAKYIHCPWEASPETLRDAGIRLGEQYPHPIVDLTATRLRAMIEYKKMRKRAVAGIHKGTLWPMKKF